MKHPKSGRVRRFLAFVGVAWFLAAPAFAAKAPDWLAAALAEDVTELSRNKIAVRLLDSTDIRHLADNRVKRVQRSAIRIITEGGRYYATCSHELNADMERVIAARGWIVSPDGKKTETFALRDFSDNALKVANIFWPQKRVLRYAAAPTMPLGSVFAWEFEVESQSSITDLNLVFPMGLPSRRTVFDVAPAPGGRLAWRAINDEDAPAPISGELPGSLRWERRDFVIPSIAGERPPGFLATPRGFSVRNIAPNNPASIETWLDLARLAAGVVEPRLVIPPEVKAKAEALVAGKANRWERVRALAEFVQKEITYLAVILDKDYLAGYRPHACGEVLQNRFGDCKDKAGLFVAMLRAIGDEGELVLVAAGNPKAIRPDWPSARFNHVIAGLPADNTVPASWPVVDAGPLGKLVLFDATDPNTPLGLLSAGDQGGYGLVASTKSNGLIKLPVAPAELNSVETRVQARLDAAGNMTANVEEVATGGLGVALYAARATLRNERFTPVLEKRLRDTVSFLEGLQWKDTWDKTEARWRIEYGFKAPRYARRTGGSLMLINPPALSAKAQMVQWRTGQGGVVWRAPATTRKLVRLTLPEGATVEEMPTESVLRLQYATAHVRYRREGQDIVYDYQLVEKGGFLDQRDYESYRLSLQRLQESERRPILLRLEPATAETDPKK